MKVLVLGGTRFLGPFVANELLRRGHEVALLSRRTGVPLEGPAQHYSGDASDPRVLRETIAAFQPDGLLDLLHATPEQAAAVIEAGRGLTHSVHVSCFSVYGPDPICPVTEDSEVVRSAVASPAVAARIAADNLVLEAAAEGRLPATVVRLPALYGPRDPLSAEWFFAKRVLDGRTRIALPDAGLHICHRGFVQNMAWGVVQALCTDRAIGEAYNLGEERLYTLAQLAQGVAKALDTTWDLYSVPGHLWAAPYTGTIFFDLRKARGHLRYRDRMIPRDGLELTLAHLCQRPHGEDWQYPGISNPFDYAREDALIEQYGVKL